MTGPAEAPREPDPLAALCLLLQGVPRGAPGSDVATLEALSRLPERPGPGPGPGGPPAVLDLGCGTGRATLVLAGALGAPVLAVDRHRPSLDRLEAAARLRGLGALVRTRCADLGDGAAIGVEPASVELIWSEGAAYVLGFEAALRRWGRWVRPGGCLAVSECSWLGPARPEAAARFWGRVHPTMADVGGNEQRVRAAGLEPLDRFTLPASAWWDEYYQPLLGRIAVLNPGADAALRAVIEATEEEIALYRRHHEAYGYVFYLLRRPPAARA